MFFIINNVAAFKSALQSYKPTTSEDVSNLLLKIASERSSGNVSSTTNYLTQIAFSRKGLTSLGVGNTGDSRFDTRPMKDDKAFLGQTGTWDPVFDSSDLHGAINVCAKGRRSIHMQSVTVVLINPYHSRPANL